MTALDIEIVPIEGIDLDSTLPCEAYLSNDAQCGDPSAIRVTISCPQCGRTLQLFICDTCYYTLREFPESVTCGEGCDEHASRMSWREI